MHFKLAAFSLGNRRTFPRTLHRQRLFDTSNVGRLPVKAPCVIPFEKPAIRRNCVCNHMSGCYCTPGQGNQKNRAYDQASPGLPRFDIRINTHGKREKKKNSRPHVHDGLTNGKRCKRRYKEVNIGVARGGISEFFPDLPMPVRKETITKSIKDSEQEPRCRRHQQGDEVPFPQAPWYPAEKVEEDQRHVKDVEKDICCPVKCCVVLHGLPACRSGIPDDTPLSPQRRHLVYDLPCRKSGVFREITVTRPTVYLYH